MIEIKELVKNLINVGDWYKAHPIALEIVKELEIKFGGNIAIGKHSEIGYFVLHDQGEGPELIWKEKNS